MLTLDSSSLILRYRPVGEAGQTNQCGHVGAYDMVSGDDTLEGSVLTWPDSFSA